MAGYIDMTPQSVMLPADWWARIANAMQKSDAVDKERIVAAIVAQCGLVERKGE